MHRLQASQPRGPAASPVSSRGVERGRLHHFIHQRLDGRQQRQFAGHGALHQPAGDDQAVDLVGAFEDAIDARVAIEALGRILLHVAVAAHGGDQFIGHQDSISEP